MVKGVANSLRLSRWNNFFSMIDYEGNRAERHVLFVNLCSISISNESFHSILIWRCLKHELFVCGSIRDRRISGFILPMTFPRASTSPVFNRIHRRQTLKFVQAIEFSLSTDNPFHRWVKTLSFSLKNLLPKFLHWPWQFDRIVFVNFSKISIENNRKNRVFASIWNDFFSETIFVLVQISTSNVFHKNWFVSINKPKRKFRHVRYRKWEKKRWKVSQIRYDKKIEKVSFEDQRILREIRLKRTNSFDEFGVEIEFKENQYVVCGLQPKSPADRAGLRLNDVIVRVGDVSTKVIKHFQFLSLFNSKNQLDLTVERETFRSTWIPSKVKVSSWKMIETSKGMHFENNTLWKLTSPPVPSFFTLIHTLAYLSYPHTHSYILCLVYILTLMHHHP